MAAKMRARHDAMYSPLFFGTQPLNRMISVQAVWMYMRMGGSESDEPSVLHSVVKVAPPALAHMVWNPAHWLMSGMPRQTWDSVDSGSSQDEREVQSLHPSIGMSLHEEITASIASYVITRLGTAESVVGGGVRGCEQGAKEGFDSAAGTQRGSAFRRMHTAVAAPSHAHTPTNSPADARVVHCATTEEELEQSLL